VIGGLLAYLLSTVFQAGWQIKMALILIPPSSTDHDYGSEIPAHERVASGVSTGEMSGSSGSGFLLMLFCMCMTAITELGPDQWVGSILTDTVAFEVSSFWFTPPA